MNPGPVGQTGTGGGAGGAGPGGQPLGPVTPELSKAEQLKAIAQHAHAKLIQQKQQQKQAANWSPAGAPTSPFNSGPFNQEKPNSPMMYPPQAFNTPQAPMNNYLPHNHIGMMGQQQPNSINQNAMSKQQQQQTTSMLSYSNTKPLSHFSGSGVDHMGQRMTPPMGGNSQVKNPMMPPFMGGAGGGGGQGAGPGPTQGPIPGQTAHLGEEHKRMLMMKQKVLNQNMPYGTMQPHSQVRDLPATSACWSHCGGLCLQTSIKNSSLKFYSIIFNSLKTSSAYRTLNLTF
uniref:Mastermind-like 3 n=1 Tax=Nothobranchius furzeri TaxID=105023 RepID=A0A8C6LG15_NOTFU